MSSLSTTNVSITDASTTTIVTSVSGERVVVTSYMLHSSAANNVDIRTQEDDTLVAGEFALSANIHAQAEGTRNSPVIIMPVNKSLAVRTSAASSVGGYVTWYTTGAF